MSPVGEALDDDDYVVNLLKQDAELSQKRYLTNGLGSLLSKRPRGNAPKPNTRFLKNIIRETDSHNAALKAKKEEESHAKLERLRKEQIRAKRTRDADLEHEERSSKKRRGENRPGRWAGVLAGLGAGATGSRHGPKDKESVRRDVEATRTDRRDRLSTRQHSVHGSSTTQRDRGEHQRRSRSPSPRHRRERRRPSKSPLRSRSRSPGQKRRIRDDGSDDTDDSDPLEDMIGPRPAPKTSARGRGAAQPSEIDARFDPEYNPREDVNLELDEDHDDWDAALEALRDRTKWRARGAERLRAAGFTDQEIQKWEKGGEKDVEDVRWKGKGERREWDRGKVVDESGNVDVKPEWGRLKGT